MASKPAPFVKASGLGPGVVMDTAHRNRSNSANKARPAQLSNGSQDAQQTARPVRPQAVPASARPVGNQAQQGIARRQAAPGEGWGICCVALCFDDRRCHQPVRRMCCAVGSVLGCVPVTVHV